MIDVLRRVFLALALLVFIGPGIILAHGWKAPSQWVKTPNAVPADDASINRGKATYQRHCAACHGSEGRGDGLEAMTMNPPPADLVARIAGHSDGDFFYKIQYGRGNMPGFEKKLSAAKIWDTINFIRSLNDRR